MASAFDLGSSATRPSTAFLGMESLLRRVLMKVPGMEAGTMPHHGQPGMPVRGLEVVSLWEGEACRWPRQRNRRAASVSS